MKHKPVVNWSGLLLVAAIVVLVALFWVANPRLVTVEDAVPAMVEVALPPQENPEGVTFSGCPGTGDAAIKNTNPYEVRVSRVQLPSDDPGKPPIRNVLLQPNSIFNLGGTSDQDRFRISNRDGVVLGWVEVKCPQ